MSRTLAPAAGYAAWLKSSISNYEALAKSLIEHPAEKGRIVEAVVKTALRTILPGRFSIGTGFIITASGKVSTQQDLVIYDAVYNAPMILEGGTGLYPVECVYASVEVKSTLDANAIESTTKAIGEIRSYAAEKRYSVFGVGETDDGNSVAAEIEVEQPLAPRSFMFAIRSGFAKVETVERTLVQATTANSAHLHGLAVMDRDWFLSQRPYCNPHKFVVAEGESLSRFCGAVLHSIQSMEMRPASMSRYLGIVG